MNTKKLIALLLCAAMAASILCACQLSDTDTPSGTAEPTDPAAPASTAEPTDTDNSAELDLTAAVAKINGETVLTLGDVKTMFDMYVEYFANYGYDVISDQATLEEFQDDLINLMVQDKVIEAKARELGYANFTDEQKAELESRIAEKIDGLNSYYRDIAEQEAETDESVNVDERMNELILEEAIANMGDENATYESYCAKLSEDVEVEYLVELMRNDLTKDAAADEADIEEQFNTNSMTDMDTYNNNPEYYKDDEDAYEASQEGVPPLYVPKDYHRIYDIYVAYEGDIPQECTDANTAMNNLKTEYCTLAFDDAINGTSTNAARIAEIISEYKAKQAEYDKHYAEYTASAYEKINAAYARLEAGEDFKAVMADVTENTDFTEIDAYADGMLISNSYTSSSDWSSAVKDAFAKLSLGQYSQVFEDTNGLHIIYYVSDEKAGSKTLDEVHDAIAATLTADKKDEVWNALIEEWLNDGSVELMTEVYRQLGK